MTGPTGLNGALCLNGDILPKRIEVNLAKVSDRISVRGFF
jgi:hypothetical protein